MAFCKNCGQQINDDAQFCVNCGTPVDNGQQPQQPNYQQQAPVQGQVIGDPDVQQNRGIAWLAYVGLLFLVPLFARKRSPYCQYHVKQGATLFAVELAVYIVQRIIVGIITGIALSSYSLYGLLGLATGLSFIFTAAEIFLFVLAIIGIVNAATGKKAELLLIGKIPFIATLMDKIYASLNK